MIRKKKKKSIQKFQRNIKSEHVHQQVLSLSQRGKERESLQKWDRGVGFCRRGYWSKKKKKEQIR